MSSPESTARSPGQDEPSPVYIPFVLARAEAAEALGHPGDAAAEWLRQAALNGRVRVRFSDRHVKMHPINLRLAGHPANLTEEERALPYPQPISPLDDLRQGPAAMAAHHIIHETEWQAGQLRAALGASGATGTAPARPAKSDRKRKYPWDAFGAAIGAWLLDDPRRVRSNDEEFLDALERFAARLGCEAPPRTTAQPYIHEWVKGFRAFQEDG